MTRKLPRFDETLSPRVRNMTELGTLVRNRRAESSTRIDDTADMVGVSKDVLSRLENGKPIGTDKLLTILKGMGLDVLIVDRHTAQRVLRELETSATA